MSASEIHEKISQKLQEIQKLTEEVQDLKRELIKLELIESLHEPKLSPSRIVWKFCKFPVGTGVSKACWVDPRGLIESRTMVHARIYLKYIKNEVQESGFQRVFRTLFEQIGIQTLEVKHHPDRKTTETVKKLQLSLQQEWGPNSNRVTWTPKTPNEFHLRELHFLDKNDNIQLCIFCDRDFNDLGNPSIYDSKEVNFLYYKQDNGNGNASRWKKGIRLNLDQGITSCEIGKILDPTGWIDTRSNDD